MFQLQNASCLQESLLSFPTWKRLLCRLLLVTAEINRQLKRWGHRYACLRFFTLLWRDQKIHLRRYACLHAHMHMHTCTSTHAHAHTHGTDVQQSGENSLGLKKKKKWHPPKIPQEGNKWQKVKTGHSTEQNTTLVCWCQHGHNSVHLFSIPSQHSSALKL